MDYAKANALLNTAVCSYRFSTRPALAAAALLVVLPFGAQAATLQINPSQSADNVIELSGELTASVTHTAEGMVIEIPGVEISVDCAGEVANDSCTVTIGAGGASAPAPASAESPDPVATTPASDDTSDDDRCSTGVGFGCSDDGTVDGASTGSGSVDNQTDDSSDIEPSGTSGGGYTPPPSGGSTSDPNDPCAGPGFKPDCSSGSSSGASIVAFPNGDNRKVSSSGVNLGSSNNNGQTSRVSIPKGTVRVLGLTMAGAGGPTKGTINFGPVGAIGGVNLRAWISTSPDGARVSASCGYNGYVEGSFNFSIGGSQGCNLSPGGSYYFNLALCKSTSSDLNCSGSGAQTTASDSTLAIEAKYTD